MDTRIRTLHATQSARGVVSPTFAVSPDSCILSSCLRASVLRALSLISERPHAVAMMVNGIYKATNFPNFATIQDERRCDARTRHWYGFYRFGRTRRAQGLMRHILPRGVHSKIQRVQPTQRVTHSSVPASIASRNSLQFFKLGRPPKPDKRNIAQQQQQQQQQTRHRKD